MKAAIALAFVLVALGAGSASLALAGQEAATATSSAVQASGREYRISLSRSRIQPGKLRLEFVNFGEDDHDLALRRVGSSSVQNVGLTHPGGRSIGRYKVRSGTYTLWCTISNHRALGMRATLKVKRKKRN